MFATILDGWKISLLRLQQTVSSPHFGRQVRVDLKGWNMGTSVTAGLRSSWRGGRRPATALPIAPEMPIVYAVPLFDLE